MAASEFIWLRITQSGSNAGNSRPTEEHHSQRTFPLSQGKGQSLWTFDTSLGRLAALRSQSTAKPQPGVPVTPAVPAPATAKQTARMSVKSYSIKLANRDGPSNIAPTLSLPPKKPPIQKAAGEGTSKAAAQSIRRRSQRIATLGRPSPSAPKERVVIVVSSDSKPEPALEDTIHEILEMDEEVEEDPKEDPEEAPQDAGIEEEEEDPEEDPEEESAAEKVLHGEDDYDDYWDLVESNSESSIGNDPRFWNYDGDLPDWGKADPANSYSGSCTDPPLADN
ncbi:hypothetical protein PIB30_059802 [Stylosanthes scabra]|uniref:Transcription factor Iwr1 domain-containing protein n=1 Tax=Stylosanthes scabra TaxID=79078 RepID=A0ABU6YKN9_9FABA|nr:hypothetical protein [Stylosanthes scabra]